MPDQAHLAYDAFHDWLTGLPNRALFMHRLSLAVEQAEQAQDYLFAVLLLDLDRFKIINDALGHTVGDQLLIGVARRLEVCLGPGDTAARFGADDFAVLLENIKDDGDATRVADRIQKQLTAPFHLAGHEVFATASIGIALSTDGHDRVEDVLRNAEAGMHHAKALGKAHYQVFQTNMRTSALALWQLEADLRRAVEQQNLQIHYQPIVSLASGQVAGVEALLRWHHPTNGFISAAEFVPLAEETGLILTIGEWLLRTACVQNKGWQDAGHPGLRLAVNFSALQLQRQNPRDLIKEVLEKTGMSAHTLELEITESAAMRDVEFSTTVLGELSAMGIQISIDDFGTGYSSLSRLKRCPINTIKIDHSFVRDVPGDRDSAAIISATIEMAHRLRLKVVAEGVETDEQLTFLRSTHCDEMQGNLFSPPLTAEAFTELLRSNRSLARQ